MLAKMIHHTAGMGIMDRFHFTGFLKGDDVYRMFGLTDVYVMPSVSEPFGIAPLEAVQHDVPVIISRQSGIAEVFHNALKVDFWDVNEMANKMIAVLRYAPLQQTLAAEGRKEVFKFRWEDSAARVNDVYHQALGWPE